MSNIDYIFLEDEDGQTIGKNIKKIRMEKRMTQADLAQRMQIHKTLLSRYETGKVLPSKSRLQEFANALGCGFYDLVASHYIETENTAPQHEEHLHQYALLFTERNSSFHSNICDLCGNEAPFYDSDGTPYLETYYVKRLCLGGTTDLSNTAYLCPNCHKKMEILNRAEDAKKIINAVIERTQKLEALMKKSFPNQ